MQPSKELIFSYFAGQATSVQQKMIGEWLVQPGSRELYFQWLDEWALPRFTRPRYDLLKGMRNRCGIPVNGWLRLRSGWLCWLVDGYFGRRSFTGRLRPIGTNCGRCNCPMAQRWLSIVIQVYGCPESAMAGSPAMCC